MNADSAARARLNDRGGYALLLVLLLTLAVGCLAIAAVNVVGNAGLINAYAARQSQLEVLAEAGLEQTRARLNAAPGLYPDSGYATIENAVAVNDAYGNPIPGVRRTTYAGPIGSTTGQHGVFGAVISVAEFGNTRVIRRSNLAQESFAKFAYFTHVEPSNIAFGGGDQIQGPVHSNDVIRIYASGATFRGPGGVTTAQTIQGKANGTFVEGYTENAGVIPLPTLADLNRLKAHATSGGTAFTPPTGGNPNLARMRIEFLTIDIDGQPEGFFRVYSAQDDGRYLMGLHNGVQFHNSDVCGFESGGGFTTTGQLVGMGITSQAERLNRLRGGYGPARCYPGGDERLTGNTFVASQTGKGGYVQRPWSFTGAVPAEITARGDRDYLFPMSRARNPNFREVIHFEGRVAVHGTVRGRVTLAASSDILIVDDLVYADASDPNCGERDMLGLFAGGDVKVADNYINTPQQIDAGTGAPWYTFDETPSENVHAVILTLNTFTVQNFDAGPRTATTCESAPFGRGCLYLLGGIIQRTRGAVGTSAGTGYLKRYAYDTCAASNPPPYFPTTGRFARTTHFEVDPSRFDVATFFATHQSH